MKKYFLVVSAMLGTVLLLTACEGNTGADTVNDITNVQTEERADIRDENQANIQADNQADIQGEDQAVIQEENETKPQQAAESTADVDESQNKKEGESIEMKMNVQVGDYTFTATLENNTAVEELLEMMQEGPVTINMDDYSGFEKVGSLGRSLTTGNSQTTTDAGDIVLYNGNNIVMFYGSNSWSYTRIGRIDDLTDWNKALGSGSITAVFTLAE